MREESFAGSLTLKFLLRLTHHTSSEASMPPSPCMHHRRDQGLAEKLNVIKDRFDADKIVEGASRGDIFFGNKVVVLGNSGAGAGSFASLVLLQYHLLKFAEFQPFRSRFSMCVVAKDSCWIVQSGIDFFVQNKGVSNSLQSFGLQDAPVISSNRLQVNVSEKLNKVSVVG